jgi:hypothetical protein
MNACYKLIQTEGLALGMSSGINVAGAKKFARELGPGHNLCTILCDFFFYTLHYLYQPQKRRRQQQRTTTNLYLSFHHLFSYRTWCHNFFILFFSIVIVCHRVRVSPSEGFHIVWTWCGHSVCKGFWMSS